MKIKPIGIGAWFLGFLLLALSTQCVERRHIINTNFAWQYQVENASLNLETRLYHQANERSLLYFKIPAGILKSKSPRENFPAIGRLLVRYKIYKNYESAKFSDSASLFFEFTEDEVYLPIEKSIEIKTERIKKGVIDLNFIDLNQGPIFKTAIAFDKLNNAFPQHDFLLTTTQGDIIYQNHLTVLKPFMVFYRNEKLRKLHVRYYDEKTDNLPPPPFQEVVEKFKLPEASDSNSIRNPDTLLPQKAGLIHIRSERWEEQGLAVLIHEAPYPDVGFTPQLVAPVRYLTTEKEFQRLSTAPETKQALDEFWLNAGGNIDKARALLRSYYGRVQMSNRLFSACRQGWQTDRGMIYVIMGPPDQVFRSDGEETWTYTNQTFQAPLTFYFKKMRHPWCENEFELMRSLQYRTLWYANIEAWRKGRIDTNKP